MYISINLSVSLTLQHCFHRFITLLLEPANPLQTLHVVVTLGHVPMTRNQWESVTEHMGSIVLTCIKKNNNTRLWFTINVSLLYCTCYQ